MAKAIPINRRTKVHIGNLLGSRGFQDSDSYELFIHVLVCGVFPFVSDEDDSEVGFDFSFVPLPRDWLAVHVPNADWRGMISRGLLVCKEYQRPLSGRAGLCREFAIPDEIIRSILEIDQYDMGSNFLVSSAGRSDFRAFRAGNRYYDEHRDPLPAVVVAGMKGIRPMPFNPHALREYLRGIDRTHPDYFHGNLMLKMQCEAYHLPTYSIDPEGGYTAYASIYEARKTGRIFETFGLQGASRRMRAVALSGVPSVYNYDLRASQALGLLLQFNISGVKCSWLEDYCFDVGFQDRVRGELPKGLWKTLLYCTFFGGRVSPRLEDMRYYDERNQKEIYLSAAKVLVRYARENGLTSGQIDDALVHFCAVIEPLKGALSRWRTYLITDYLERPGVVTGRSKKVVTNPCGMKLRVDELEKIRGKARLKSALAAHVLQGFESAYVHRLVALSETYGFTVYSNQHDGLIVDREIPSEAHEQAKRLSGLLLAELELKPIG